jgi:hypothetical protein
MKADEIEVPIHLPAPIGELTNIMRDLRKLGRMDVCMGEAYAVLADDQTDDAAARQKALDWLKHAYVHA